MPLALSIRIRGRALNTLKYRRLDRRYRVDRLRRDLEAAEDVGQWHQHFGPYHDGGWSALPLVSADGATDARSLRLIRDRPYLETPIAARCPYLLEIVRSFLCPRHRVRLTRLAPGAEIQQHRDRGYSWEHGHARVHVPIVTNADVEFWLEGERLPMAAGELWYCDFSRPHQVVNRGAQARVHLVLDLEVNDWLAALLAPR